MKKYILPFMSIAMLMAMASCSSSDDEVAEIKEESKLVPMTFTATQESNAGTRTALNSDNKVVWKTDDKISVFDWVAGTDYNHEFSLSSDEGSTSGSFTGEVLNQDATFYYAVYPYTEGATLASDGIVSGITLPAEQTATKDSFDPNAALMMAVSTTENKNQLEFKNAISLVKVTPKFSCTKIELEAAEGSSDILAGKGTLKWNNGEPTINFTGDTYNKITLTGSITQGNSYYIVVPTGTLNRMWKITFTADDETNTVYTRYCSKPLTIERNKIIDLGVFETSSLFWADAHRGYKVTYEQEVDFGITVEIGGVNKKVIFANANLTATGLAEKETDFGDYFAWGATTPWYTSYTIGEGGKPKVEDDNWEKTGGYILANAPYYDSSTKNYTKYTTGNTLEEADDAANVKLGGDWQLPTKEIWQALKNTDNYNWDWTTQDGYKGYKVTSKTDNTKTIFLPAAGYVLGTSFKNVGLNGTYWSGTADSSTDAYALNCVSDFVTAGSTLDRFYGFSVRPVRLVAVD